MRLLRALPALTLLATTALSPLPAFAQSSGPTVEMSLGADGNGANGGFDLFLPFHEGPGGLTFADFRLRLADDELVQGSAGLGWRAPLSDAWTLGLYSYLDYARTERDNSFQQFSFGGELLSRDFSLRFNGYLPFGDRTGEAEDANAAFIENERLIFRAGEEHALRGFDAEAGMRVPVFAPDSPTQLNVFGGGYWFKGVDFDDILGAKARAELSFTELPGLSPGTSFALSAGLSYDDRDKAEGMVMARLRIPLGDAAPRLAARDPAYARVERAERIRTVAEATGPAEAAVYADTGEEVGALVRISSASGDASAINGAIAGGGENALILASGAIALDDTLGLGTGQFLLGGGGKLAVTGADSGGKADFTYRAKQATLTGTDDTANVLAMSDRSGVIGLAIRGGYDGIVADTVSDITIRDVDVAETGNGGIQLSSVSGALIEDSLIHDLEFCEDSTECEFSIYDPGRILPNAAVSLFSSRDVTIRDLDIENVTYGILGNADFEYDDDWALYAPNPTQGLTIENVTMKNTRREALHLIGTTGVEIRDLSIDNRELDRTMDLVVIMSSTDINMDGLTLLGGLNGLQFIGSPMFAESASDISVSNARIEDQAWNGIMFNLGSENITLTNIAIRNVDRYGIDLYGPFMEGYGKMAGISFENVSVTNAGETGVHLYGYLEDIDGDIAYSGSAPECMSHLPTNDWDTSTFLTQSPGHAFSINGGELTAASIPSACVRD